MKLLKQLIKLHKILFMAAVLFTFLSVIFNLCWNRFLAQLLNLLGNTDFFSFKKETAVFFTIGILVILIHTISEFASSLLSSYTSEMFAHELRMGYAKSYLQSDLQTISKLNVGKEQSVMQNELQEISTYLSESLFPLMKQFGAFVVTVLFLLCQNLKLTMLSVVPVIPLIAYCSFSSKIIKNETQQCQNSKQRINGLADMILGLFPIIQIYSASQLIRGFMEAALSQWGDAAVRKERITAKLMSLSGVLSFVPLLLLLGFGGSMVIHGEISLGTFYIFINLSGSISGFLQNMPGSTPLSGNLEHLLTDWRENYVFIRSLLRKYFLFLWESYGDK